ncbi:hypothetical protein [Leifsonia sp. NPDC077715]|uniref:hypothetical protein n=1 Tax=Leifsonia sp. NPDC077715 TaxID=3155539 RepID=UPI0034477420
MDEILGESPFEIAGESSPGQAEFERTAYQEAAESRLDELEAELGEQPWTGETESPPGRPVPSSTAPLAVDPRSCPDVTYRGEPWNRGRVGRHQTATGTATQTKIAESAAVRLLDLGDFDVDDYRLRPAHRTILGVHVAGIADALRRGRIVGPILINVQGRTSSTGSMAHNLALSRHRAVNVTNMIRCLARQARIEDQLTVRWTPLGESVSQTTGGDNVEGADSRQVRVQVIAPRPTGFRAPIRSAASMRGESETAEWESGESESGEWGVRYGTRPRVRSHRPAPGNGYGYGYGDGSPWSASAPTRLCFEVVSLRRSPRFAWLRVGGLRTVTARVRVHEHGSTASSLYVLQGVLLRSSRTPGPAHTAPLARLTGRARRILAIAMQSPNPRRGCSPVSVVAGAGSATRRLGGMAILVIPPAGSGRALLRLSPRSQTVRFRHRLISVRARRYAAPVLIVGRFRLLAVGEPRLGRGETASFAEAGELTEYGELGETEWTEAEHGEQTEYGELGEAEWAESAEVNEYGEWGEAESNELEWAGVGELSEFGELGESEWNEAGELNEFGELGESEWNEAGELNEFSELGESEWNEAEFAEAESEWAELGEGESEYGRQGEYP